MIAEERKNGIIEILQRDKIVKIETLAEIFGVSEMTIRRDLEKCEHEGFVRRCHGGAVVKNDILHEIGYAEKKVSNLASKEKIAAFSAGFVKPGSTIYLDAGTTMLCLAKRLLDVPDLTVITNDLITANLMAEKSRATIIMLGGTIFNKLASAHGYLTERMLQDLRIEIAFVGGCAINEKFDLFTFSDTKVSYYNLLVEQSNKAYLLVDESKFYRHSLFKIHNLDVYSAVITDKQVFDSEQVYLNEKGINFVSVADWNEASKELRFVS